MQKYELSANTEDLKILLQQVTPVQHTWVDDKIFDKLNISGEATSFNVTGIGGAQLTTSKLAQTKMGPRNSTEQSRIQLMVNSQQSMQVGKNVFDLREMKKICPYLSCVAFK